MLNDDELNSFSKEKVAESNDHFPFYVHVHLARSLSSFLFPLFSSIVAVSRA